MDIIEALRKHNEPQHSIIADFTSIKAMGETIAENDTTLWKLAATCEFGNALQDTAWCAGRPTKVYNEDTGAALSVISKTTKNRTFPKEELHSTDLILKTYTNEQLEVLGPLNMKAQFGNQT